MKHLIIIALAAMLLLSACATSRQKLSPNANVALRTANMELANGNVDVALKNYEIVLGDRPDHAVALSKTGRIYFKKASDLPDSALANYTKAYDLINRSIKVYESFTPQTEADLKEIKELKDLRTSAWARIFKMGEDQQAAGNTKDAIQIFEAVYALDSTRDEPLRMLFDIYREDKNSIDKAESTLLMLHEKKPSDLAILKTLGAFYYSDRKDYAKAVTYFEQVKAQEPANINTLQFLAFSQYELGRYDDALGNIQMVLSLEPNNLDALADAKSIAYRLNNKELALDYLKKLLAIKEGEDELREITVLLNEMKRYQEMITYAEKWYEFNSSSKDAVLLIIGGAKELKNKTLEKKYNDIFKKMK